MKEQEAIIKAQQEYTQILLDELDSTISLAGVHGWRSQNVEKGIEHRQKLRDLFKQANLPVPELYLEKKQLP